MAIVPISGNCTSPKGFLAAGGTCGLKASGRPDVGAIVSAVPATSAAVFTKNLVKAAPVLVSLEHLETLCGRIRQLNSQSPIEFIRQGEVDPKSLIELGLTSSRASLKTLQFLGEALNDAALADVTGTGRYLGQRSAAHNSAVKTLSLRFTEPFEWLSFSSALELLTTLRGPDLLRIKGIVNVDGEPIVIQGVQHIIDTPVKMDRWPSDDKDSRLVFIVRNMELDVISNLFQAVGAIKSAPLRAT